MDVYLKKKKKEENERGNKPVIARYKKHPNEKISLAYENL
jgi:hypothetical protein